MVSLIHAKRDRLRALLTGTDEDEFHDIAVSLLESDDPESVLATLDIVGHSREQSVRLLPAIVNLLSSSQHVPCTNMENPGLGHQSIALAAMRILLALNLPLPADPVLKILNDDASIELPEACYDQGAYIGDYATFAFLPAAYAARVAWLCGAQAAASTRRIVELIGLPAASDVKWAIDGLKAMAEAAKQFPPPAKLAFEEQLRACATDQHLHNTARAWAQHLLQELAT